MILSASLAPAASIQTGSLTSRTLGSKRPREEKLLPLPSLLATRLMVLMKVFKSLLVLRTQRAGNLDKKLRTDREAGGSFRIAESETHAAGIGSLVLACHLRVPVQLTVSPSARNPACRSLHRSGADGRFSVRSPATSPATGQSNRMCAEWRRGRETSPPGNAWPGK